VGRALGVAAIAGALAGGCGPRNFANENDALRRERDQLRERIDALELELIEARAQSGAPSTGAPAGFASDELAAATPTLARIEIHRMASLEDTDGDGAPDAVRLRIATLDGRARFVQIAGRIDARVERVRGDDATVELGTVTLGPAAVRDAYVSGLGGTAYAFEVPVRSAGFAGADRMLVSVAVTLGDGRRVDAVRILDGVGERWALEARKSSAPPNSP
jgi:hypothetical protein